MMASFEEICAVSSFEEMCVVSSFEEICVVSSFAADLPCKTRLPSAWQESTLMMVIPVIRVSDMMGGVWASQVP